MKNFNYALIVSLMFAVSGTSYAMDCNSCPGGWAAADDACAGLSADSCAIDCFSDCEPNCSQSLTPNNPNEVHVYTAPSKDRHGFTIATPKPPVKTEAKTKR